MPETRPIVVVVSLITGGVVVRRINTDELFRLFFFGRMMKPATIFDCVRMSKVGCTATKFGSLSGQRENYVNRYSP